MGGLENDEHIDIATRAKKAVADEKRKVEEEKRNAEAAVEALKNLGLEHPGEEDIAAYQDLLASERGVSQCLSRNLADAADVKSERVLAKLEQELEPRRTRESEKFAGELLRLGRSLTFADILSLLEKA